MNKMKTKLKKKNKEYIQLNKEKLKKCRKINKCEHDKFKGQCKLCNFTLYLINLQRLQINRCFKNSN